MHGIPIVNVNNNCSTGSSALLLAKEFVEGGLSDCVLALGFEKMERGSLSAKVNKTNQLVTNTKNCACLEWLIHLKSKNRRKQLLLRILDLYIQLIVERFESFVQF